MMYNSHMDQIKKITDQHHFQYINQLKKIAMQSSIDAFPVLYQKTDSMYSDHFKSIILMGEHVEAFGYYQDDDFAGFIIVEWIHTFEKGALKERSYAYVHDLATHPKYEKRGIARALMNYVFELMKLHNVDDIELAVHTISVDAIALYQKMGFQIRTLRMHKSLNTP